MAERGLMIRKPEVERREAGVRRWSVSWALFFRDSLRTETRRRLFFTRRGAERWIESKRIRPETRWRPAPTPEETRP